MSDIRYEQIEKRLHCALELLRIKDNYLLKNDVNERSITHKLAEHLQYCFNNQYDVDCEYNRNIKELNNSKIIRILQSELSKLQPNCIKKTIYNENHYEYLDMSVFPDIIVHKRGEADENLLIIEVKKSTSCTGNEYDYKK